MGEASVLLFQPMRFIQFAASFAILAGSVFAQTRDRDLSSFGAAERQSAIEAAVAAQQRASESGKAQQPTAPKVATREELLRPPSQGGDLLPARTFQTGDGFARIQRRGRGLDFTFNDSPFEEAIAEISRTFDVVITYAGDPDRRIIGRYGNIRTAGELLALLTDMTDLIVVVTQRGFIVQQVDSPRLPTLKLDDVLLGRAGG